MATQTKPIPPLYTVYILRSTVRHASLYIGSTPNPPRRLKQHNGEAKGGANRTSRKSLRPWEMVGIVSGFPGLVAALKFEWALTNPHTSKHIPSESRISISTRTRRDGRPRRPSQGLTSILSNLHLLLRVPSFSRWPLELHFFVPEVYKAWQKWCADAEAPVRDTVPVHVDFGPGHETREEEGAGAGAVVAAVVAAEQPDQAAAAAWGIHALPLDYAPIKDYVLKTQSIFDFEREGACVVCGEVLGRGEGLYAVCSNAGCEGVGHATCWSRHLLGQEGGEALIPVAGACPRCKGPVRWGHMMKETSLRLRGKKEMAQLLKKPRKRKTKVRSHESPLPHEFPQFPQ